MDEFMREGVSLRKLFRLAKQRLWMLLPAIGIGMLLFGGGYLLAVYVLADAPLYRSEALYYITFDTATAQETQLYYNDYTWNAVLDSDEVAGVAARESGIDKAELAEASFIPTMSDIRMIRVWTDAPTAERSEELRDALGSALEEFALRQDGFVRIECWDTVDAYLQKRENLVLRWLILGAALGCAAGVLYVLYRSVMDESVSASGEDAL